MNARQHVVATLAAMAFLPALASCAASVQRDGPGILPAVSLAQISGASDLEVLGQADYRWRIRPLGAASEPFPLERLRGRVLFIHLWATWCAPCVAELATIAALRDSLRPDDVTFVLVSPEEPARVEAFLRRHRYDLPAYVEAEPIPAAYGLEALPTTFVVDRSGRIVLRHRGAADWDAAPVRAFLRYLAAPPTPNALASPE
jgi:thiol-disulfide isomerase/thioredoxin